MKEKFDGPSTRCAALAVWRRAAFPSTTMLVTSELRWFNPGAVPPDLVSWFTEGGRGTVEERRDLYRLDGCPDAGVKMRGHAVLELKCRRFAVAASPIDGGPYGRLEVWHKWSPADALVGARSGAPWIDVRKRILRRRFAVDGTEVELSDRARSMDGAGCDVEIVSIGLDGVEAWSLALAAYGPQREHRASIESAWRAVGWGFPICDPLPGIGTSCGYPEWLEQRISEVASAPDSVR